MGDNGDQTVNKIVSTVGLWWPDAEEGDIRAVAAAWDACAGAIENAHEGGRGGASQARAHWTGQASEHVTTPARRLLWACIEDYAGLWELRWELNGYYDDPGPDGHLAEARDLVKRFLEQGWVEAYWCEEPYGDLSPVSSEELGSRAQLLDDDAGWELPDDGAVGVRLSATEVGEQAYRSGAS